MFVRWGTWEERADIFLKTRIQPLMKKIKGEILWGGGGEGVYNITYMRYSAELFLHIPIEGAH